jgi:hypothetical protein
VGPPRRSETTIADDREHNLVPTTVSTLNMAGVLRIGGASVTHQAEPPNSSTGVDVSRVRAEPNKESVDLVRRYSNQELQGVLLRENRPPS